MSFYIKGKEAGFKASEISLLHRAVAQSGISEPSNVFWSDKALNRCIREVILHQRGEEIENALSSIQFLSSLFELRKRIALKQPQYARGIANSNELEKNQSLRITSIDSKSYGSQIIDNLRKYFAIIYPKDAPPELGWKEQTVQIQFSRKNDASYIFETEILDAFEVEGIIHVKHSNKLQRIQRRSSVRISTDQSAKFSIIYKDPDKPKESENDTDADSNEDVDDEKKNDRSSKISSEYRCRLLNISEDGVGIMVGGRARAGMHLKLQIELGGEQVILNGSVKNVLYSTSKNLSILNVKSRPVNTKMKNRIRIFVYGIFSEEI